MAAAACGDDCQKEGNGDGKPKNRLSDEEVQFDPDTSDFPPDEVEILNRAKEAFNVLSDDKSEESQGVSDEEDESERETEDDTANGKPKNRLPDEEVRWILSRKRQQFEPDTSDCAPDSVRIMNRAKEAFDVLSDNFAEFQEEVRTEYEAKGYVEVDDDYFERREEHRQSIRDELADLFDGIDLSGITFSDMYYNNLDEDENDEEHSYCSEDQDESDEEHSGCSEDEEEGEGEDDGQVREHEKEGTKDPNKEEVSPGSRST